MREKIIFRVRGLEWRVLEEDPRDPLLSDTVLINVIEE